MDNKSNITSITTMAGAGSERDRILAAAVEEVGESGLLLFSLESVARRAQMTRYDVDQHYADRRSLVIATGKHVAAHLVTATKIAALNHPADPIRRILSIARCHFDRSICPVEHIAVWSAFDGATRQNTDYQAIFHNADIEIGELIEQAVTELLPGNYPSADASAITNAIFGAIDRYWLDCLYIRTGEQLDKYNESAVQAIEHLLGVLFPNENLMLVSRSPHRATMPNPRFRFSAGGGASGAPLVASDRAEHQTYLEAARRVIWTREHETLTPATLAQELGRPIDSLATITSDWDEFQYEVLEFILSANHTQRLEAANAAPNTPLSLIAYIEEYAKCDAARLREDRFWHEMLHHPRLNDEVRKIDALDDASVIKHLGERFDELIDTWNKPFDGESLALTILGLVNRAWTSCTMIESEAEKRDLFEKVVLEIRSHLRTLFPESFSLDVVPWTGGLGVDTDWRSQIYRATCRAIAHSGIDRCDFNDVAKLCGLSSEDIRRAFATPRQLHAHTLTWLVSTLTEPIEAIMNDHSRSNPQKLLDFGDAYFDPVASHPTLTKAWHIYHGSSFHFQSHGEITTSTGGETVENLTHLVTPLVHQYKMDISPSVIAAALHGVLDQHFMDSAMIEQPDEQRRRALTIYGDMVRWLFPEEYTTRNKLFSRPGTGSVVSLPDPKTGQSRRERLIASTIHCVCVIDMVKIRQSHIAEHAGLSENSIGYHFGSLDFLMQSALASCLEIITTVVTRAIRERTGDPATDLTTLLAYLFDTTSDIPTSSRVWIAFWGASRYNPMYLAILDEADGAIREYTSELVFELIREHAPHLHGEVIVSAGIGLYEREWDAICNLPVSANLEVPAKRGFDNCVSYYASLFPGAFPGSSGA